MKVKTKNKIKEALRNLWGYLIIAIILFTFWLTVGTYGQVRFKQGYNQGFFDGLNNAKKPPAVSTTLSSDVIKAIHFAEPTDSDNIRLALPL